ncbi:MAG: hypothetical protein IJ860_02265 [Eubacterium sp.]|nr:hypothetical protein [Eubacterium sp.]
MSKKVRMRIIFLALAGILCILPFFLKPVYFMEPDDYLLNFIANGSYGAAYSPWLVFIQYPAGMLLKGLYALTTAVNWYAVLLVGADLLAFFVLYCCIWEYTRSWPGVVLLALVNGACSYYFLTFTVSAFLTAAAGFALLACSLKDKIPEKEKSKENKEDRTTKDVRQSGIPAGILGAVLIWIGYCLRSDTLIPMFACALPLLLHICLTWWKTTQGGVGAKIAGVLRTGLRKAWAAVLILLVLVGGTSWIEKQAYSSDEWKSYMDFTDARGYAVDYPTLDYNVHREEFEALDVSNTDYAMLVSWKFAEKQVFTVEKMNAIGALEAKHIVLEGRLRVASEQLDSLGKFLILLPLMVYVMLLLTSRRYPWKAGLLTVLMEFALAAALLFIRMRFVLRVELPISVAAVVMLLLLQESKEIRKAAAAILICVIAAGWIWFVHGFHQSSGERRRPPDSKAHAELKQEIASNPDVFYIMDGGSLSTLFYYNRPVTQVKTTDLFQNVLRSGSWDTFSPRYYHQVEGKLANPDNLLTSLRGYTNLRFVSTDAGLLRGFLEEHTELECKPVETEYENTPFKVYQFAVD